MDSNDIPPTITVSGWRSVAAKAWASPSKKRPLNRDLKSDAKTAGEAHAPVSSSPPS